MKPNKFKCYILSSLFLLFYSITHAQLKFIERGKILFVGGDSIEGKKIISGIYITPIDSFNLKMELSILDDWKLKDSLTEILTIDKTTINANIYFIDRYNDSFPAYRYTNLNGFELFISKERFYDRGGYTKEITKTYNLDFAQVYISDKKKFYVKTLPLMFKK